jgi:putative ABC transport system permease protein
MTRLTLRGLAARKLRTALTAIAVVLGVAMISGTYVLTDTIDRAFDQVFAEGNAKSDVVVTPGGDAPDTASGQEVGVDPGVVDRVAAAPGIADAEGGVTDLGITVLGTDGTPIERTGPPILAASVGRFSALTPTEGRLPTGPGEVAMDTQLAEDEGFAVGDRVTIAGDAGAKAYAVTGIARYGTSGSIAGASVVAFTVAEAQRVLGKEGRFDQVSAAADAGVSAARARDAVRAALRGEPLAVRTGAEEGRAEAADIQGEFSFLRTALLIFAGIAVFVGAFVIYNTFSITVAQRTRELALLRTLGASRRQVLASVVLEAAIVGLVAAVLGLLGGLLVAPGIVALFDAIGIDLPTTDTVVVARTVVVAFVVGVGVTVIASVAPALRATGIPPVAAMRDGLTSARRGGRIRFVAAAVLATVGAVMIAVGLIGGGSGGAVAGLLGGGAAIVFLGVALLSPWLVPPMARAVGAPLERLGGMTGRLARENATRNPGRTAVTAASLMIGLALVTFVTIFAAGLRGSVDRVVDRSFAGDLTVSNIDGFSPVAAALPGELTRVPGVSSTSGVRFANSSIVGGPDDVATVGVDPRSVAGLYRAEFTEGSFADLRPGTVLADKGFADAEGLRVGSTVRLLTPRGERPEVRVAGIIDEGGFGLLGGGLVASNEQLAAQWGERRDSFVFVDAAPGADLAQTRARVDRLLETRFPGAESQDREEVKEQQAGQINAILGLFYALLALSVIVSLFGIVNTLALSIFERTRELGMLRAIGTSRRQVRRSVRYEAAITALIGAVLGLVLGVVFALVVSRPLEAEGFEFALPVGTLLALLVVSALLGVLAAIGPARRAARVDVLRALAYE